MAATVYTITLSSGKHAVAKYDAIFITYTSAAYTGDYAFASADDASDWMNHIVSVGVPTWSTGVRQFAGYYDESGNYRVTKKGKINNLYDKSDSSSFPRITADGTWTAHWTSLCPVCDVTLNGGTAEKDEIYFNAADGKWYLDYPFATELSAANPLPVPTREKFRFLGVYSSNNASTGTLYVDAHGRPTDAFLALSPTSDVAVYALWEQVSYKVTLKHASGTPTTTVFYYGIVDGKFYADDLCTTEISGIESPRRELYQWNGAFSSSSQTDANRYVNSDGSFTSVLTSLTLTADKTVSYANYWTQVSYKITLYGTVWSQKSPYYTSKTDGGIYDDWLCGVSSDPLDYLPVPTRAGYRFLGYYSSNATTGTRYVDGDGLISDALKTAKAAKTIYPQGRAATCTMTLDPNGGSSAPATLYYDATSGDAAFFGADSATTEKVVLPIYTGNVFLGYFTDADGGTQVVGSDGAILSTWTPTETATVYAHWQIDVSIVDVDAGEATAEGTTRFWYRASAGKFYADAELTTEITSITPPTRRLFALDGIYSGETLAVDSSGAIQPGFVTAGEEFVSIAASWTRRCYEMTLSAGGGVSAHSSVFRAPGGAAWYADEAMTVAISNVGVAERTGYDFGGYAYSGVDVIGADGAILDAAATFDEDFVAAAKWTARQYTLTFDGGGATPSFAQKVVTFGSAVGVLPTVSNVPNGKAFSAWKVDGAKITADTVWSVASDRTAVVQWITKFGNVTDWFDLASSVLVPIQSDSGDDRQRVCAAHNGKYESGVNQTSCVWRNPRVVYAVKKSGDVKVTLGRAFSASYSLSSMQTSGYMITSVAVQTKVGEFPTVTVEGTANEGNDAINTWSVSIPVVCRAKAQDPFSAVSGGGYLNACTVTARCDPVVVAENLAPCASDVVNGRIEMTATTIATTNQTAPSATNGFTSVGVPVEGSESYYTTYTLKARKEL